MKFFEDKKVEQKEVTKPEVDNAAFIKRNLMKSVDRSQVVREAVERWLYAFHGAITKAAFEQQLRKLDFDDTKALEQIEKAMGRRTISLPPIPRPPLMPKDIVAQMLDDNYVAISGRRLKKVIKEAVQELKNYGEVYVLPIEELIVEFKSFGQKGAGPQMIEKAIETDFLIIVDLEMPIHLEWHIVEAIERIGRLREKYNKPIISTWNRFNDCNRFFERFKIYT